MHVKPFIALAALALSLVPSAGLGQVADTSRPEQPPPGQWIMPNIHRRPVWAPRGQPIEMPSVNATIEIEDQVASTMLEITLRNPSGTPQEAVLVFPVSEGVTVRSVQYDGVGPEPTAAILPREEARRIYDEIVRASRDPALVEFVGMNLVRTSVFPIPARGSQKLRLKLEQLLTAQDGRVDYVLPRSNSFADSACVWSVSLDIRSKAPITTVYSPSHTLTVEQKSANRVGAKITGPGAAVGTIRLSYLTKQAKSDGPSFSVLMYPDSEVSDRGGGYFMLLGGVPDHAENRTPQKREVVIVMDRSGSMRGEKLKQAQAAAEQVVEGLLEGEAFNIIDYSDSVRSFAERPVVKTAATAKEAKAYIAAIRAEGGTNIHDALLEAVRPAPTAGMLPLVIFLTDGLPTIGERNEGRLRRAIKEANTQHRRIFSFGVGFDVNTPLLSALASQSRGMSTFVLPEEDVEVKVSRVFRGLQGPVVGMPRLRVLGSDGEVTTRIVRDVQPAELPDFFEGDQIVILGQYVGDAPATLRIEGDCGGEAKAFDARLEPASATMRNDYIPRMWASQRIAALLDEVRQSGAEGGTPMADARMKELIDEVVRLSTKYGILTEYTAFLAREETDFRRAARPAMRESLEAVVRDRVSAGRTGAAAVNQEANLKSLKRARGGGGKDATVAPAEAAPGQQVWFDEKMNTVTIDNVRQVGDGTLYQRNNRWVDARILEHESERPDRTVEFGTDEYLRLAEQLRKENRIGMLVQGGDALIQIGKERVLFLQP